jgi:hypothetical protein
MKRKKQRMGQIRFLYVVLKVWLCSVVHDLN